MAGQLENAQWKLLIDINRDGDFGDATEDISAYVIEWHWKLGMSQPYQEIGDEAEATFVLDNQTGYFSPEKAGPYQALLDRGTPVLVQSLRNGVTVDHYTGWIESVQPTPGTVAPRRATMYCMGIKNILEKSKVYLELMEDVTADQVIDAILQQINVTPANATGNWVLGLTNFSELGEKTWLTDMTDFHTLQTGLQIFSFVGDSWQDGVTAMDAIADVVSGERGRAFQGRNGKYIFWNRAELQTNVTSLFDVTDTIFETMDYRYGENLANVVKITVTPRTISAADELLWEAEDDIPVPSVGSSDGGKPKVIRANFKSTEDGTKIAGRNLKKPSRAAGTLAGTRISLLSMQFEADARSAKMILSDPATVSGVVRVTITTLQIYGQKLTTWKERELEAADEDSLGRHGRHEYTIPSGILDDEAFAQQVVDYELARRKDPRGEVLAVTLRNSTPDNLTQMLTRTMGDRISVSETQTGHASDYFIIGEAHDLIDGTQNYTVTWYLETASASQYWVLGETGFSELGETTFLGL